MATKSVERLVEEAMDAFDDPEATPTSHVRRAIRIASKRQDYVALLRLLPETFDFSAGKVSHPAFEEARVNLTALLGRKEADRQALGAVMRHMQCRKQGSNKTDTVYGQSIAQLEGLLAQYDALYESYREPPQNLTPIDTYIIARDYDAASAKLLPVRRSLEDVIERIKQAIHDFLIETERQMESGQRRPDIFERGKEYVERGLRKRTPDALEKFRAAEDALDRGESEDLAHALTSCRRMMKALADALYPATGEVIVGDDGRERTMSDEAYRNRLLQFATERLNSGTHKALLKETLRSLGDRLQRLNELSSKGVHDEVDRAEAETCVMWTYLTAADFLRLADGTSASSSTAGQTNSVS